MRVLVFAAFYYPFKGGYVESLHGIAKRLVERGFSVTVLTGDTHRVREDDAVDGVRIVRIPCWNPKWLNGSFPIPKPLAILRIFKDFRKRDFDVVWTNTRFFPTSVLGFFFAKLKRMPCVHTERGGYHMKTSNWFTVSVGILIDHTFGWLICRFSNKVVGNCEAVAQFTRHLGARSPIVIYNGIDADFWSGYPKKSNRNNETTVTFVGRLIFAKGVQDLFQAVVNLKDILTSEQYNNLIVNIIGDGPYRAELEVLAQSVDIQDGVRFFGEVSQEQIREVFSQTDIFVNPSYSEGNPRSVFEAAAAGIAIIATDVGGTREIIPTPEYGILIEPHASRELTEKLTLLIARQKLRDKLGRNVREYVQERFDWQTIIDEYAQVFSVLL